MIFQYSLPVCVGEIVCVCERESVFVRARVCVCIYKCEWDVKHTERDCIALAALIITG